MYFTFHWFGELNLTHGSLVFYLLGAAADLSESEDNTLTSKTDLSMLSDEGLELSQRQTDTMFQGPSLDEQAEELVIGAILEGLSQWTYATGRKKNEDANLAWQAWQ